MAKTKGSLGVMIDFSRNGVMTLPALKKFITILKKMGYNTLFLYMEDTYEVEGEPYFGYMRSHYSLAEMREIDEFCAGLGVEAIPCIQTLAHMRTFFKWDQVPVDCDDILLVGEERTYELIHNMFKSLSSCFRSKKIHIGMDEAHLLGKGAYYRKNGYKPSSEIIKDHLDKVCEIAKEFDYELLMWSDMFFRTWNNDAYYVKEYKPFPKEVLRTIPKNVTPVYWDYYATEYSKYDMMIKMHKQLPSETWFAGGAWTWAGFAPLNNFSNTSMRPAMEACKDNKVKNIFITMWGDDGMECSVFSVLPSLCYIAECAKGNFDEEKIRAKFKRIVGVDYDDFMALDLPNILTDEAPKKWESPSKYMLYSDPFLGFLDYTVAEGVGKKFAEYRDKLAAIAKKTRSYGYIFSTIAELCNVMELKYELGAKTRAAYKAGDKAELERLAKEVYAELERRIKSFHKVFMNRWYTDNKPSGAEIHDGRLGALWQRVASCKKRLLDYCAGKLDKIDELEVEILPFGNREPGEPIMYGCYGRIVTGNQFTHAI